MKKLHQRLRQESTVKIPTPPPDAKQVVEAVGNMYHQFPFPPPQRKHTYRQHAVFVHQLLKKLQINPKGKLFGDIACGTGLMMLDYALEFPETRFRKDGAVHRLAEPVRAHVHVVKIPMHFYDFQTKNWRAFELDDADFTENYLWGVQGLRID